MANRNISPGTLCALGLLLLVQCQVLRAENSWQAQWQYESKCEKNQTEECLLIHMNTATHINLSITNLTETELQTIRVVSNETDRLLVLTEILPKDIEGGKWQGPIDIEAIFIGKSYLFVEITKKNGDRERSQELLVVIVRPERLIDTLFIICVATLVSILYINFGAALDLGKVKGVLRRPIGPAIAFCCHFIFLPLSSYALGLWLFPGRADMQLGLFFTGSSPAGGASNTWTVLLGGNLDASITMSTTSTLAAFVMTPLWIFTLGKTIFDRGNMKVPYGQIASSVFSLIIPLAIGLLIQRYYPRVARFLVRILKICSACLILFIVIFAIATNLYLFKLFTWEIYVAGLLLPWLGYFVGWLAALIFRQEYEDRLAISIEAGIQNTGIAIFVLRSALSQPEADLTTVLPVSVAIMTPFPLIAFYLCLKVREWLVRSRHRYDIIPSDEFMR
ncbi:ileal sodium/bile acid cotransporter-like isoform X1 [Sitodiplosis mosellana]|uniref:ileal sodium/bile acid cotransporter-like isoform X1 n=1 Tax=Sitodiplosis mosellana TaxID=263140 RepID=UPI0024445E50|nr:ileal sodium/bile acid cotransporter-like isoform X1 [Sitodiplosis mosellana]